MHFYLAIIFYISSVVAGIISLFAVKNISRKTFLSGCIVHLICLFIFIYRNFSKQHIPGVSTIHLSFLFAVCTGLILAGLAWKSKQASIIKVYFSLYALTIVLFFLSPSRLINFLLTSRYTDTIGKSFAVGDNYFLEEQAFILNTGSAIPDYKLIMKKGFFHQTIQRNISFAGRLDSIKVIEFVTGKKTLLRGYSSKVTFVSTETDSLDVELRLVKEKKNKIERRL